MADKDAEKKQTGGESANIEWRIMDKTDFFDYLKKLKNRDRADKLFESYEKWKKKNFSDQDAIRKAFASLQLAEADKRLDKIEEDWPEEELANKLKERKDMKPGETIDENENISSDEREIIREIMRVRQTRGHALAQQQKSQKFFNAERKEEEKQPDSEDNSWIITDPNRMLPPAPERKALPPAPERKLLPPAPERKALPPVPERKQITSGERPYKQITGLPERKALPPAPERKLLPPALERKLLPPHEDEPQRIPEQTQKPHCPVIVDSHPMREIPIEVSVSIPAERRPVTFQEVFAILSASYDPQFSNHHATQIVNQLIPNFITFIGPPGPARPPAPNAAAHIQAILATLPGNPTTGIPHGVNNPDVQDTIIRLLLDRYYSTRFREITLDEWRQASVRAHVPVPFFLTRPTGYLVNYSDHPVTANQFTIFSLELPPGNYIFTAPETVPIRTASGSGTSVTEASGTAAFERWDIIRDSMTAEVEDIRSERVPERVIRSRRTGVTTEWNRVVRIDVGRQITRNGQQVPETVRIVAYYKADAKFDKFRPSMGGAYQGGTSGGAYNTGTRARRDSLYATYGAKIFNRGGIDRNREAETAKFGKESGYNNTSVRAATNKGKRILNQYARAEYTRIFTRTSREFADRADRLRELRAEARGARRNLRRALRQQMGLFKGRFFGGQTDKDLTNRATDTLQVGGAIAGGVTAVQLQEWRDILEKFNKAYDDYFRDFKQAMESDSAQMESHMLERAQTVTVQLARRFKMPLNGADENQLAANLRAYALEITERFVARGRTGLFAMTRGLENLSRGLQTGSEVGMGALENLYNLILGPWTWTTILVLFMFFFTLTYVGYNVLYLWVFPIIGGGFTLLLNFSETFKPLDWITHFMSGAIIGSATVLLLVSLGALNWTFITPVWFWIIWGVIAFLGVMQFYQTGGWKVALQGGVVILVFSWVALGPYSAYYQQALDQVKTPVEIGFRAIESAVTDVWLLATNPTEFYARQQAINVRPEKALDFAKGVEVMLFDMIPSSVPAGQEFAVTTVLKNEGTLSIPAKDISVGFGCKQWCEIPPAVAVNQKQYMLCRRNTVYGLMTSGTYTEYFCTNTTGACSGPDNLGLSDLSNCVNACKGAASSGISKCTTPDASKFSAIYASVSQLDMGAATTVNVRGFKAHNSAARSGETKLATVLMNVSYRYATASSLLTEVMSQTEINRRLQNRETVFRNVPATAKASPGRISINVGPQPVIAGKTDQLLLISVFSTRDDGEVRLAAGTEITINAPKSVVDVIDCGVYSKPVLTNDVWTVKYTVQRDVTILSSDFQSIFAFICNFNAADVDQLKTDLITAEIPDYTFVLMKKKDITVTPPLGIIFDPNEKDCQKYTSTDEQGCFATSKPGYTCWFEHEPIGVSTLRAFTTGVDSSCHSCGIVSDCSYFRSAKDCLATGDNDYDKSGAKICRGLNCYWDNNAQGQTNVGQVNPSLQGGTLDPNGACKAVSTVAPAPSPSNVVQPPSQPTGNVTCPAFSAKPNFVSGYNLYAAQINSASSVLSGKVAGPNAAIAAIISQESAWRIDAVSPCGAAGLGQFIPSTARSYGLSVPVYNFVSCNPGLCGTKVSECNACTPSACSASDERFDSQKIINAIASHMNDLIDRCGSLDRAINAYNSGNCNHEANAGYQKGVLDYYQKWQTCV